MDITALNYPLHNGYIHNWLVAGVQATEVKQLERFSGADWKLQIARQFYSPEPGIRGEPAEQAPFTAGELQGRWSYVRTRDDHFVDLSAFYHLTHYLRAWAGCEINSEGEQDINLILTTNGPADVWLNGSHVHRQEHFYLQIPHRVRFSAHLVGGINQLLVRVEAVAIRACPFAMALQLVDCAGDSLTAVRIPTTVKDIQQRIALEAVFEAAHLRQDVYAGEQPIQLFLPESAAGANFSARLQSRQGQVAAEVKHLPGMGTRIDFGPASHFTEGEYQVIVEPAPGTKGVPVLPIRRAFTLYATRNSYSTQPSGDYTQRRQEALQDAAQRSLNVFCEIAKMELGYWDALDLKLIYETIDGINRRKDCSDFFMLGLLGMVYRYGSLPQFPAELQAPLKACILNFKYWIDEPCSDGMCYWTENHNILFHACEILAGQLYPDELFSNVNQPGSWHIAKGERLAREWLIKRAATGFREWDSNTYFEEDTLALATLASLAQSPEIAQGAATILNKLFYVMAVNSFKGVFGSTHGRTYTPFIKTGYREGTSGISRLLWGMGIYNDHVLGSVSLACSTFRLPALIAAIAADLPQELWNREQHTGLVEEYNNMGSSGTGVNKVTYKTPDYMLSSAQDWRPIEKGYQQHIWQATLSPMATVFTSHPPCAAEDGAHRPNFWHGNETLPRVVQYKDVLVGVYKLPDDDWMGFTHAYFPLHAFDEVVVRDSIVFGRVGEGYIALYAAQGLQLMVDGDNAYRELRSYGLQNAWVCQMGRQAQNGSFAEFIQHVLARPVSFQNLEVEFTSLRGDQVRFGWQGPLLVNGQEQAISGYKHFDSPYCTAERNEPETVIHFGNEQLTLRL